MFNRVLTKIKKHLSLLSQDLTESLVIWRYWTYRAYLKFRLGYQDSRLGLIWPSLSLSLIVIVLGTVWGIILERGSLSHYLVYLFSGFPVWQAISATVNGANNGVPNRTSNGQPLMILFFERLTGVILSFSTVMPMVFVVMLATKNSPYMHFLFFPFAVLTIFVWALGVFLTLSVIVTLRPDIKQLISALMRVSFLATPVIWEPSRLGEYVNYIWWNPFFAPLELVRYSISGIVYMPEVIWITPLYAAFMLCLGLVLFARYINRIKFRVAA